VVDLAPATTKEDEETDPASNVEVGHSPHLVRQAPLHSHASSRGEGHEATQTVVTEEHGSGDNKDGELDQASEQGAPDRADTAVLDPGAANHENRVQADECVGDGGEGGDESSLRALLLAVDIAFVNEVHEPVNARLVSFLVVVQDLRVWGDREL